MFELAEDAEADVFSPAVNAMLALSQGIKLESRSNA
jgi:hypothetical protein